MTFNVLDLSDVLDLFELLLCVDQTVCFLSHVLCCSWFLAFLIWKPSYFAPASGLLFPYGNRMVVGVSHRLVITEDLQCLRGVGSLRLQVF